jgi:secondary thiamine-phosphate synthase enzyme
LFLPHTTAALTTADLEPGGDQDLLEAFEVIVPKLSYKRVRNPDQASNYIMSAIIDPSITIPVQEGRLKLGIRQRLVLIELNGPRDREVTLTFLAS